MKAVEMLQNFLMKSVYNMMLTKTDFLGNAMQYSVSSIIGLFNQMFESRLEVLVPRLPIILWIAMRTKETIFSCI